MIVNARESIKDILESTDGVHLTAYLVNRGDLADLRRQIRSVVAEARKFLAPIVAGEKRRRFLRPLEGLLLDARVLREMSGNIGLFRTKHFFRILSVPVPVETTCVVATSFHVKPLLRWMQQDQSFLLLGLEKGGAHLFYGTQASLARVDSLMLPIMHPTDRRPASDGGGLAIHEWIEDIVADARPELFVAGEERLTSVFFEGSRYARTRKQPISPAFSEDRVAKIVAAIRSRLRLEAAQRIEDVFKEFRLAEETNASGKDIHQIAKAAVRGGIRKLIVADGIEVFGKLDASNGGLRIHPFELDHEDDDLLDDIAQTVLRQGGEVIVAPRDEIPKGRPILAIFNRGEPGKREAAANVSDANVSHRALRKLQAG